MIVWGIHNDTWECCDGNAALSFNTDTYIFLNIIILNLTHSFLFPLFLIAGVTIFRASSFFIIVQTTFGLQLEIQLSPIMQVYIAASTVWQQRTCGMSHHPLTNHHSPLRCSCSGNDLFSLYINTCSPYRSLWKLQQQPRR